jgi:hypothetical protein
MYHKILTINVDFLIYIQQDALHNLFYLETALHVLGGTIIKTKNRSIHHPEHTQTRSSSSMMAADSNNGYVHHSFFKRTYCIFRRNTLSTTIVILT